jgi:nucleoside-diphosphate-sugar epimerase
MMSQDVPVRILILGGTRFLGRAITEAAIGRGDTVTPFNRGRTSPGLYPGVETVAGDREAGLSALAGREWDAVIDVAGYVPQVVRLSAQALAGTAGRYVFVSTCSVYADQAAGKRSVRTRPSRRSSPLCRRIPITTLRPAAGTIRDTLAWDIARGGPESGGEGLSTEEEQRLLAA